MLESSDQCHFRTKKKTQSTLYVRVWKYKNIKYTVIFFCVCALWCKQAQHAWAAWQNEMLHFPLCCHFPCSTRKHGRSQDLKINEVWGAVKNCAIITPTNAVQLIIYTKTLKETEMYVCERCFLCFGGMDTVKLYHIYCINIFLYFTIV